MSVVDFLEFENVLLNNYDLLKNNGVSIEDTVTIESIDILELKENSIEVEVLVNEVNVEVELGLSDELDNVNKEVVEELDKYYKSKVVKGDTVKKDGVVFIFGSGESGEDEINDDLDDSIIDRGVEVDKDDILSAEHPGFEDEEDNVKNKSDADVEDEDVDNKEDDFSEESVEDTGIELYHNGQLYNTKDNLKKVKEDKLRKEKGEEDEEEVEDVESTKSTGLSVIDYKNVLNHINREEIKMDYFRYYRNIEYTPSELNNGFVDKVKAWVSFKAIKENGDIDKDGVSVVDIPLDEDDKMEFNSQEDAEEYFSLISREDSGNMSEGIEELNGNRYVYFKGTGNANIFNEEVKKWKEHFNSLKESGRLDEYMKSKGYRPKRNKKVSDVNNSNEDELKENTEESNEHRKDKSGYFKMEVDEVITGLRKQDLAIRGVYQFVDNRLETIKNSGVTDICLKEIMFEYEWGNIEGVGRDLSQSIVFYYKFDIVTSNGVKEFKLPMRVKLEQLNDDGKPYIKKEDFGDLIIKTDNLISEMDKKEYHKFLYKGITVYIGKKGIKEYKDYLKESGVNSEEAKTPKVRADSEGTSSKEDMIALIERLYIEVQQRVDPHKHRKANEMLVTYLREVNLSKSPAQVQFHGKFEGVCIVIEEGSLLNMDTVMDNKKGKNKGEVLVVHPYFVIAANGNGVSRVVYKKETSAMSLDDLENMLIANGYSSLKGISKVLNLRNYGKFKTKNNVVSGVVKKGVKSGASRAIGNAMVRGSKYAGKAMIGANKKKR